IEEKVRMLSFTGAFDEAGEKSGLIMVHPKESVEFTLSNWFLGEVILEETRDLQAYGRLGSFSSAITKKFINEKHVSVYLRLRAESYTMSQLITFSATPDDGS